MGNELKVKAQLELDTTNADKELEAFRSRAKEPIEIDVEIAGVAGETDKAQRTIRKAVEDAAHVEVKLDTKGAKRQLTELGSVRERVQASIQSGASTGGTAAIDEQVAAFKRLRDMISSIREMGLKYLTPQELTSTLSATSTRLQDEWLRLSEAYDAIKAKSGVLTAQNTPKAMQNAVSRSEQTVQADLDRLYNLLLRVEEMSRRLAAGDNSPLFRAQSIIDVDSITKELDASSDAINTHMDALDKAVGNGVDRLTRNTETKFTTFAGKVKKSMDNVLKVYGASGELTGENARLFNEQYDQLMASARTAYGTNDTVDVAKLAAAKDELIKTYRELTTLQASGKQMSWDYVSQAYDSMLAGIEEKLTRHTGIVEDVKVRLAKAQEVDPGSVETQALEAQLKVLEQSAQRLAEIKQRIQDLGGTLESRAGGTTAIKGMIDALDGLASEASIVFAGIDASAARTEKEITSAQQQAEKLTARNQKTLNAFERQMSREASRANSERGILGSNYDNYLAQYQQIQQSLPSAGSTAFDAGMEKAKQALEMLKKYREACVQLQHYGDDMAKGLFGELSGAAEQAIKQLQASLDSLFTEASNPEAVDSALAKLREYKAEAGRALSAETLQMDRVNLTARIRSWMDQNTGAAQRFSQQLGNILKQIETADAIQLKGLSKQFDTITNSLTRQDNTRQLLRNALYQFSPIAIAGTLGSAVLPQIGESIETLKSVDTYLTEISKVSSRTTAELKELGSSIYDYSNKYGVSVKTYLQGVQEWSRAGYEAQSGALGDLTIKAQSAGDMTADAATSYLIATNAAYKYQGNVQKLSEVLDGQNQITNRNAVSMTELAEATKTAAAQAASAGIGIDQFSAAVGTIQAVTQQGGATAGRAFRAILMNLQQVTGSVDDGGEEITTESLNKVEEALGAVGIKMKEVRDGALRLRDPMTILKELSAVFSQLDSDDARKANIISAVGGKVRGTQLAALLNSWDMYEKMLKDYSEGTGSAAQEAEKSARSWEGSLERMKNSATRFISYFADSDVFKGALNFINGILTGSTQLMSVLGKMNFSKLISFITTLASFRKLSAWGGKSGVIAKLAQYRDAIKEAGRDLSKGFSQNFEEMGGAQLKGIQKLTAGLKAGRDAWRAYITEAQNATGATARVAGILSSVGSILAGIAISAAVSFAVDAIEQKLREAERIKEEADAAYSNYKATGETNRSNRETLNSIKDEFVSLSKGVDANGRNVSLTNDEYDRYLNLSQQIAEILPGLTNRYGENGEAMYVLRTSAQEYNAELQRQLDLQERLAGQELISKAGEIEQNARNAYNDLAYQKGYHWRDTLLGPDEMTADSREYAEAWKAAADYLAQVKQLGREANLGELYQYAADALGTPYSVSWAFGEKSAYSKYTQDLYDIADIEAKIEDGILLEIAAWESELEQATEKVRALAYARMQQLAAQEGSAITGDIQDAFGTMLSATDATVLTGDEFESSRFVQNLLSQITTLKSVMGESFGELFDASSYYSSGAWGAGSILNLGHEVRAAIDSMSLSDSEKQVLRQQITDAFLPDMEQIERQMAAIKRALPAMSDNSDFMGWVGTLSSSDIRLLAEIVPQYAGQAMSVEQFIQLFNGHKAAIEVAIEPTLDISDAKTTADEAVKDISALMAQAVSEGISKGDIADYVAAHGNPDMLDLINGDSIDMNGFIALFKSKVDEAYGDIIDYINSSDALDAGKKQVLISGLMESIYSGILGDGGTAWSTRYKSAFDTIATALAEFRAEGALSIGTLTELDGLASSFGMNLTSAFESIDGEMQVTEAGLKGFADEIYGVLESQLTSTLATMGETDASWPIFQSALNWLRLMKNELGDVSNAVAALDYSEYERRVNGAAQALSEAQKARELKAAQGQRITAGDYKNDSTLYGMQRQALREALAYATQNYNNALLSGRPADELDALSQKVSELRIQLAEVENNAAQTESEIRSLTTNELTKATDAASRRLEVLKNELSLSEAMGQAATVDSYRALLQASRESEAAQLALRADYAQQLEGVEQGSARYDELSRSINGCDDAIIAARQSQAEWNQQILDAIGYSGTVQTTGTLAEAMNAAFKEQFAGGILPDTALNLANWLRQVGLNAADYLQVNAGSIEVNEEALRRQALQIIDANIAALQSELDSEANAARRDELTLNLELMINSRATLKENVSPAAKLGAQYDALTTKIDACNAALAQQGKTGAMTLEQFNQLISTDRKFADMMEFSAGTYQLNTRMAYEYLEAQRAGIEAQAASNRAEGLRQYEKNRTEVQRLTAKYGSIGNAYMQMDDAGRLALRNLLNDSSAISQAVAKYNLLESSLSGVTEAYEKWLNSDNMPSPDDFYYAGVDARKALEEGLKSGKTGAGTKYAYAEEYLFGEYGSTETGRKSLDRYFKIDATDTAGQIKQERANMERFLKDLESWGLAKSAQDEAGKAVYTIDATVEDIMDKTQLGYQQAVALLKNLESYGFTIDWSKADFKGTDKFEDRILGEIDATVKEAQARIDELKAKAEKGPLSDEEKIQLEQLETIVVQCDTERLKQDIEDAEDTEVSVDVKADEGDAKARLAMIADELERVTSIVDRLRSKSIGTLGTDTLITALGKVLAGLKRIAVFVIPDKTFTVTQRNVSVSSPTPAPLRTRAAARGTSNSPGGKTLVGELGKELLVRDGHYYELGVNGAQFVNLKPGDIVLDAEKTRKIERGLPGARGKALASGTQSTIKLSSLGNVKLSNQRIKKKDLLEALLRGDDKRLVETLVIKSPSITATGSSTRVTGSGSLGSSTGKKSGSSGSKSSGGKSSGGSSGSGSSSDELFDWIEVRIDRLQRKTDNLIASAEASIGHIAKNAELNSAMENVAQQIDTANSAYTRYMEQAGASAKKSKLSADLIAKVQSGDIDITKYSGNTQEAIEDYKNWYDKALAVKDSLIELNRQQTELATQKLDNIINQYENLNQQIQTQATLLESTMALGESQGKLLDLSQYNELIALNNQQMGNVSIMKDTLSTEMESSLASGAIQEGSEEWFEYTQKIASCDIAMVQLQQSTQDYLNKIDQIRIKRLDFAIDEVRYLRDALEDSVKLKDAMGKRIDAGDYQAQIDNITRQTSGYKDLLAELRKQLSSTERGSNKYIELAGQIAEAESNVRDLELQQVQLNRTIAEMPLHRLEDMNTLLGKAQDTLQGMMALHEAQGELLTALEYEQLIASGDEQIRNLEAQRSELEQLIATAEEGSNIWQEYSEQLHDNAKAILDIKTAQEEWNDAIIDLEIDRLSEQRDLLDEQNTKYQKRIELEKALQELERAKQQRTRLIYREGQGFVYERDEAAIKQAQEALDDKRHEEVLDKIDEAIDALEEYKKVDNLYDYFANRINASSAAARLDELDDLALSSYIAKSVDISVKSIVQSIREVFDARQNAADTQIQGATIANAAPVSISINSIALNGVQDVNGLADAIVRNLPNTLTQKLMSNK